MITTKNGWIFIFFLLKKPKITHRNPNFGVNLCIQCQILRQNMKNRILKDKLIKQNSSPLGRILVLTGARQTGKTTLALKCFLAYKYLSIEDPVLRIQYKKLTAAQWHNLYPEAILDEVQKESVLIESIKSAYDQYKNVHYILLGSSQLLLLKKVKESLAGRCIVNEVYPLTIPELLTDDWDSNIENSFLQKFITGDISFNDIIPYELDSAFAEKENAFSYYLKFGGYPALVNSGLSDEDRYLWLENYIKTYLERDVRDLADFRYLEPFLIFQKITATLTSQLINYSYLGKEAGVSSKTARRFLEYLDISYQTFSLPPWHKNKLKRLVKTPKLHYLDPGIQRAILKKRGEMSGNEFESAIAAEIYKQLKTMDFKGSLYHLRTHDGKEVDILLEMENGYIPIEIKMTTNVTRKEARHLFDLDEILDKPVIKGFVLSNDHDIKTFGNNIIAMPAAMFLS